MSTFTKKHTPGPWDLCCDSSPRVKHMRTDAVYAGMGEYEEKPNGVKVSKSVKICKGIASSKDGCLIAAAPDLLDALRRCLQELEEILPTKNIRDDFSAFNAAQTARKAIAKAEGRTP